MIMGSFGRCPVATAHDHERRPEPAAPRAAPSTRRDPRLCRQSPRQAQKPVGPAVLLRLGEALAAGLDLGFGGSQVRAGLGVRDLAWQHALVRSRPVWVINSIY